MEFKKTPYYNIRKATAGQTEYVIGWLNTREWELIIKRGESPREYYKYSRYAEAKAAAILDSKTAPEPGHTKQGGERDGLG